MKRVLFVDDERAVLEGLRRMLHPLRDSWALTLASSAKEALASLRHASFDAIISDVSMPGMDGLEFLEELNRMGIVDEIPIVMLTGNQDLDMKRRSLDLGATDLLNKPVQAEDLIARLRSVLRLKTCQDDLKAYNGRLAQKVAERTEELADSRLDIVWRLGKTAEFRDEETGNHVVRVGCYCRVMAEAMGMDGSFVERIFLASPLHDIGKVGVPDRILLKCGPLHDDEWEIMKRHCEMGSRILRDDTKLMEAFRDWERRPRSGAPNPILEMAATIALTHHERWDGGGYPAGLEGEAIPFESRIVAIADVYDALRSERPYKPALPHERAFEIMNQEMGRQFDPTVFDAFECSHSTIQSIRESLADPRAAGHGAALLEPAP